MVKISWYVVTVLYGNKSFLIHENFIFQECLYLVKANEPLAAYDATLVHLAESVTYRPNYNAKKEKKLFLMGVIDIMPVCESFEDGNELGHRYRTSLSWEEVAETLIAREEISIDGPP